MASKKKIPIPFVSRGGIKLEHALNTFHVEVRGLVCLDVGSSTGGFTDCLLQRGAGQVYAVDVGYGQLADKLRKDHRVVVMERTHAAALSLDQFSTPFDLVTVDVSFISMARLLPHLYSLVKPDGYLVGLVKPNFEVGREKVGKKGVVRKPEWHVEAIELVSQSAKASGFQAAGLTFSPLKGPEGNIEYFCWLKKQGESFFVSPALVVEEACRVLGMPGKHKPIKNEE